MVNFAGNRAALAAVNSHLGSRLFQHLVQSRCCLDLRRWRGHQKMWLAGTFAIGQREMGFVSVLSDRLSVLGMFVPGIVPLNAGLPLRVVKATF